MYLFYMHYDQKVQKELDKMELMGVISKVDIPTSGYVGIVIMPRKVMQSASVLTRNP